MIVVLRRLHRSLLFGLPVLLSAFSLDLAAAGLSLEFPGERLVFQRNLHGFAEVSFRGRCDLPESDLAIRLVPVADTNLPAIWHPLGRASSAGAFSARFRVSNGWFSVEMRAVKGARTTTSRVLDRLGVGEVFIVTGHSVAQGGELNLPGTGDERVMTFPLNDSDLRQYELTAKLDLLPPLLGTRFTNEVKPAPFGHGTYFWARFAEELARREEVPVLLLNAGFGGTSLEHWAKSARGEPFDHGFVRSALRMPYINLQNALERYARVLGLRAILSDHGQNDWPELNEERVFQNYRTVILQARRDLGFDQLAIVVNRQTPGLNGPKPSRQIRSVQERVIRDIPACYPGPDYDQLAPEDRPDGIHLGPSGLARAASLWTDALSGDLLNKMMPFTPNQRGTR